MEKENEELKAQAEALQSEVDALKARVAVRTFKETLDCTGCMRMRKENHKEMPMETDKT